MTAAALGAALRARAVPVIVTVSRGRVVIDVRTLLPGDEALIARAVAETVT